MVAISDVASRKKADVLAIIIITDKIGDIQYILLRIFIPKEQVTQKHHKK